MWRIENNMVTDKNYREISGELTSDNIINRLKKN